MKRTALILAVLAMLLVAALAWAEPSAPMFGIKGGLNVANLWGEDAANIDARVGLAVGCQLQYPISQSISLQGEILYSMKGATETIRIGEHQVDFAINLDYIEIPALMRATLTSTSDRDLYLLVGPALALKVSSKISAEADGASGEATIQDVKSTDLGLIFGVGLGLPMTSQMLSIEARYDLGLMSVDDNENDAQDIKNGAISLLVGYSF